MLNIQWEIEGEKQLVRRIEMIGKQVNNWTPTFRKVADYLKDTFSKDVFDTQGRAVGAKWPPLSQSTIQEKNRNWPGRPPLVRTGAMKGSFTSTYKSDYAAVWNTAFYFKYHQSNKPRTRLPRRVMMRLGNEQRELVVKEFHNQFIKTIRGEM